MPLPLAPSFSSPKTHDPYPLLHLMAALSFAAMFVLMYAMVDRVSNAFININQFFMSGIMAALMVVIELVVMRARYPNKRPNAIIATVGLLALAPFWLGIHDADGRWKLTIPAIDDSASRWRHPHVPRA